MARQTITRAALMQWALLAASVGPAAAADSDKLTKVRFISTVADDLRPFLYALNTGLFKQAGLDIDFERSSSGATVAQAIVGGAMDIGKASISSIISAYVRGLPFVLIAPGQLYRKDEPTAGVMVLVNSPLKTPLDLQGKTIACTALGDITYLGLRSVIDQAGGDSSTVKWVELPMSGVAAAKWAKRHAPAKFASSST
jgi:NitT/TauT family transport system substrate-binding protein